LPPYSDAVLLSFDVGVNERHSVRFSFRKLRGSLVITVDGVPVVRTGRLVSPQRVMRWDFVVGDRERHEVRIEKYRKGRFPALRAQPVCAYVDGRLVAQTRA
jgi:hypothetical protein